jgi:hypothetical protein
VCLFGLVDKPADEKTGWTFGTPHLEAEGSGPAVAQLWIALWEWYRRAIQGQTIRGRKRGAAPVLDAIRPVYADLVASASRRTEKHPGKLTAEDIVQEAARNGLQLVPNTVQGWWRERKLPRPEDL